MIVIVSAIVGIFIVMYMKPIDAHLHIPNKANPVVHLFKTMGNRNYLRGFAATVLLATGGFMLMPFASAYSVNNLGIPKEDLTLLYLITGVCSMAMGPFIGKLADSLGKFKVFVIGTIITSIIVIIYCHLGVTPFWAVVLVSVVMFAGVSSRMISSSALLTAVPEPKDRGAFMGINASIQQISGGVATFIAGLIVIQSSSGKLERYDFLGYVVVAAMLITLVMMYILDRYIKKKASLSKPVPQPEVVSEV
jgi:predicted MFS family arabinose efflux permease